MVVWKLETFIVSLQPVQPSPDSWRRDATDPDAVRPRVYCPVPCPRMRIHYSKPGTAERNERKKKKEKKEKKRRQSGKRVPPVRCEVDLPGWKRGNVAIHATRTFASPLFRTPPRRPSRDPRIKPLNRSDLVAPWNVPSATSGRDSTTEQREEEEEEEEGGGGEEGGEEEEEEEEERFERTRTISRRVRDTLSSGRRRKEKEKGEE